MSILETHMVLPQTQYIFYVTLTILDVPTKRICAKMQQVFQVFFERDVNFYN